MTIVRTLSAAVLTVGLAVSTLAGPANSAELPVLITNQPLPLSATDSVTSPGDPFVLEVKSKPRSKVYTYQMSCEVATDNKFANGASAIKLVNTGSDTIPGGASIVVTFPDGTKKKFTAPSAIEPGAAVTIMGPPDATPDNFSCSASALAVGPYIDFGVPEGGRIDPNSPPKLVCAFTVVNGKLVITYKNIGGQPLKGFQHLQAKAADSHLAWFSYVGEVDLPPGKTMQKTLTVDNPSQYIGQECHADFSPN